MKSATENKSKAEGETPALDAGFKPGNATSMKTNRRHYGPFNVITKTIRATLKFGVATLKCEVQQGQTPMGRKYRMTPQWWIKLDSSPCASGPWTADAIRKYHTA